MLCFRYGYFYIEGMYIVNYVNYILEGSFYNKDFYI